ncbi:MAG: alpha/beta hydrolase, partial [Planctomycetes bacterium]|nr:alpha/beta hydrolase [Planctomycetota bacterium]
RVPENHFEPGDRTLELVYFRVFSTGDEPADDPLLYLSGGPGGSAVGEMAGSFLFQNLQHIRAGRDVIAYDQRGTGLSNPLLCGPAQAAIGLGIELLPELSEDIVALEESEAPYVQQTYDMAICAGAYTAAGVDLAQYNSIASSYDMAALMDALGYDQYNLYGTSYGTKLAQVAVRETPDRIKSIIVDGTTPITGAVAASNGIEAQEQYVNLFEQCAADEACNAAYPDLAERFDALLDRLAENPIPLDEPIRPSNFTGLQFPDLEFDAIDLTFFQELESVNSVIPYRLALSQGLDPVVDQVPAVIAAIEADDVETVRSIFEDSPSLQAAGVEPVAEFPDEGAMRPDNEYVAPALGTLLEEGQKALTLTLDDTPEKIWTGLVMSNLSSRLEAGEDQTDVLRDLIEFSVLPVQGLDKQVLIDYANEYLPEELAASLNGIADGMTERDVRATMWHINDVAAAMSYTDEAVESVHPLILFAVNCPESVVLHSQADVDASVAAARFPQLDEFEENTFAVIEAGCSFFPPTEYIDSSFIEPVISDTPALLIQGGMDVQTP